MKIACLGGGPAGLYFAISMKLRDRAHDMVLIFKGLHDPTFAEANWQEIARAGARLQAFAEKKP